MTRIQHRLSAVLITAVLCPAPGVYGGGNKQDGVSKGTVPPTSVHQGVAQAVVNEQAELAALDAATHPPWTGDDRQHAQALFARLKQRKIAIQPTFYQLLGKATPAQRSQLISRCLVFFNNVDTQEIANTCCLTSMVTKKSYLCSFLSQSHAAIQRVARTIALKSLTSLFNNRGFPRADEDTQAFIERDVWWQGKGAMRTLDQKLLSTFSSIFSGRGLPDEKAIEDYLQLDVWWQGVGEARTLDRELLRTFSSMFSGRGLPDKKAVEDYLRWDVWWQGDGKARALDRELLRMVSLIYGGQGLPDKKAVEDYLGRDLWWQGVGEARRLDRELLGTFSSMFNGRGLPETCRIDEILGWLTFDQQLNRQVVKLMTKLYLGVCASRRYLGLPDINTLNQLEQKLTAVIPFHKNEGNDTRLLIKMVALYLANDRETQQLHWADCEAWLREYRDFLSKTTLLRQLLLTLHHHGGRGIKEAVILISGQPPATKRFVLDALARGEALVSVQYALNAIEPSDWPEYLFFTRELHPVPSCQQWQTIKGYLKTLTPVMPNEEYQRGLLTLIWSLAPGDWERFVQPEAIRGLTKLLPSIQVMGKISRSFTTDQIRTLFDTCLTYQAGQPDKEGLPILFQALLLAQLPLFDRGPIIPGVLAQIHDQPEGVVVGVDPAIGVVDSMSLFIQVMATLLGELWKCEYTVNGQTLSLWPRGKTVPMTLPTPSLGWHPDGVQIRHWTSVHLHQFCQAMAVTPHADSACSHPLPTRLETVLKKSVWSQADLDQLYNHRDQLTIDQVIDILFQMDQSVPQNIVQRWYVVLGEKHQPTHNSTPAWMDGSDQAMETIRDIEDILKGLVPDV